MTNTVLVTRPQQLPVTGSHPFEPHEAAFQLLIRFNRTSQARDAQPERIAVQSAYEAAINAATRFCVRVQLKPCSERAMGAVREPVCEVLAQSGDDFRC